MQGKFCVFKSATVGVGRCALLLKVLDYVLNFLRSLLPGHISAPRRELSCGERVGCRLQGLQLARVLGSRSNPRVWFVNLSVHHLTQKWCHDTMFLEGLGGGQGVCLDDVSLPHFLFPNLCPWKPPFNSVGP